MKIKQMLKNFAEKIININYIRKAKRTYNKQVDELHMFDLPDWVHGIKNLEIFMNILGDCIEIYKTSVPTKKSLSKAFSVIYKANKYTRSQKEHEIMLEYYNADKSVLMDVFEEYSYTNIVIPYGRWMLSSIRIKDFNLKQIAFVDYMLRHPELFVAMKKIKKLKTAIKNK